MGRVQIPWWAGLHGGMAWLWALCSELAVQHLFGLVKKQVSGWSSEVENLLSTCEVLSSTLIHPGSNTCHVEASLHF